MCGPPSRPHMPIVAVHMTDEDVIRRVGLLLGRRPYEEAARNARWKPTWFVKVTGHRAAAWMRTLRPLMGARRQGQIDRALASYAPRDSAKLSDEQAMEAIVLLAAGRTVREVAERFAVTVWCIYDLRLGRTRPHLDRSALGRVAPHA